MVFRIYEPLFLFFFLFQAASFILGNLLDVLEEIQSAQIQVSSLMSSTFSAHSGQDDILPR